MNNMLSAIVVNSNFVIIKKEFKNTYYVYSYNIRVIIYIIPRIYFNYAHYNESN